MYKVLILLFFIFLISGCSKINIEDNNINVLEYNISSVPNASENKGLLILVSNEINGSVIAFSDGTEWRRVTDREIIS